MAHAVASVWMGVIADVRCFSERALSDFWSRRGTSTSKSRRFGYRAADSGSMPGPTGLGPSEKRGPLFDYYSNDLKLRYVYFAVFWL